MPSSSPQIINIKNEDEYCFLWSIIAHLHPAEYHKERPSHYNIEEYINEFDLSDGLDEFPYDYNRLIKFHKKNKNLIEVNVFELNVNYVSIGNITPFYSDSKKIYLNNKNLCQSEIVYNDRGNYMHHNIFYQGNIICTEKFQIVKTLSPIMINHNNYKGRNYNYDYDSDYLSLSLEYQQKLQNLNESLQKCKTDYQQQTKILVQEYGHKYQNKIETIQKLNEDNKELNNEENKELNECLKKCQQQYKEQYNNEYEQQLKIFNQNYQQSEKDFQRHIDLTHEIYQDKFEKLKQTKQSAQANILYYQGHFILCKDVSIFTKTSDNANFPCLQCMTSFRTKEEMNRHLENCQQNDAVKNTFTKEDYLVYNKWYYKNKVPFIVYCDFEAYNVNMTQSSGKHLLEQNHYVGGTFIQIILN